MNTPPSLIHSPADFFVVVVVIELFIFHRLPSFPWPFAARRQDVALETKPLRCLESLGLLCLLPSTFRLFLLATQRCSRLVAKAESSPGRWREGERVTGITHSAGDIFFAVHHGLNACERNGISRECCAHRAVPGAGDGCRQAGRAAVAPGRGRITRKEKAKVAEKGRKRGTKNGRHSGLSGFLTFRLTNHTMEGPPCTPQPRCTW